MGNIEIRRGAAADAEMLAELSRQTFWDAFHAHPKNAPEDLAAYMKAAFNAETIRAELAEKDSIFLIAEIEREPVGYAKIMIGSIEPPIEAEKPVELNRLYSKQEFFGKGVGKNLMEKSLEEANKHQCDVMWLGVWEFNPRAQAFYRKYGFRAVGRHVFQLGADAQVDVLMRKDLTR